VAPAEFQENEYKKFHTPLGQVLEYIRVSKDKEKLDQLLQKDPIYSKMERDSANLINTVTNSKLTYMEEGNVIDMCKAIEDMRADAKAEGIEEGRAEGRAVGIEEGRAEGKTESLVSSIKNVMDSIHVSIEEAMDILKVDPQKRQEYAAKVK
jgi:predicted transposase YdaD